MDVLWKSVKIISQVYIVIGLTFPNCNDEDIYYVKLFSEREFSLYEIIADKGNAK